MRCQSSRRSFSGVVRVGIATRRVAVQRSVGTADDPPGAAMRVHHVREPSQSLDCDTYLSRGLEHLPSTSEPAAVLSS